MPKLRRRADRPGVRRRRALAEPLEPRILLSADLPGAHDDAVFSPHDDPADGRHELLLADEGAGTSAEQHGVRRELVFVDAGVEGYEQLVEDLRARDAEGALVEVHVLEQGRDGIAQMGEALAAHAGDLDAVHVISHGSEGGIQLGGTWLTSDSLASRASSLADWSGALADGADLLLYGCNLASSAEGQQLVGEIATLTGADVAASADLTGAAVLGGDWELEYATGSVEAATLDEATQARLTGVLGGTAIWSESGSPVPASNQFDDIAFTGQSPTDAVDGTWTLMDGAASPTRDEMIVVGVNASGKLSGQMWDGASWTALPFNADLDYVARNDRHSFDVAYDSTSGDAMLVYNNGRGDFSGLSYRIWNGTTWTGPVDIALPASTEPENIQLAARPGGQQMVLVAGNAANESYALVWDGMSWGNAAMLHDGSGSQDSTEVSVAYEAQSGNAMVLYAKGDDALYYRQWNGSSWRPEGSISAPGAAIGRPLWTSVASDPNSDKLALGVITANKDVWLSSWNGNSWQHNTHATNDSPHADRPNVALVFEAQSGRAIATYATSGSSITYRTWTSGNWSGELLGPDLGEHADAVTLDADPYSNQVMLSVVEQQRAVSFVPWNGSSWGAVSELEGDSGTTRGQPFVFLWEHRATSGPPIANASAGAPYVINEGDPLPLDASSSSDPEAQALSYAWDLDGDGDFDEPGEPTGAKPIIPWSTLRARGIDDEGAYQVGLRVTDTDGQSDITTTTLTVNDAAPTLSVSGASSVDVGATYVLDLSASDPGNDAIDHWTIDWGDGTIETVGDVPAATHIYSQPGFTRSITVSLTQDDGKTWTNSDLLVGNWVPRADALHRFDGSTGSFESTASSSSDLDRPYAVTVGPNGSYYVSGYNSNNIGRFDSTGSYLGEFVARDVGGLDQPDGLAWGPDGNLYVANFGGNNILRFDASGVFVDVFGLGGGGMNGPTGLAFGPDGDLYVASWNNGKLVKYDGVNGGTPTSMIDSGLSQPEQIVFDAAGNLYIADGANDAVKKWDGSNLTTYFTHPQLNRATGLAFGPDGALYVASYGNDRILRYDGSTGGVFVSDGSGSLDQPEYLLFTPELQVHVSHGAEAPSVTGATTPEDVQTSSGLVLDRNAADGPEVSHFKISGIAGGTLYHNDGTSPINDGDFITWAEGYAGLRFTPAPDYFGPASFDVQASSTGDEWGLSTAVTAAITVTPVNDAPVLDASGTMMLTDVIEGDSDPAGNTVASIIASAGGDRITDVDPGALEGIAVIGVDDANGTWEYSIDGGTSWSSFAARGVPSASTDDTLAVHLADDALIRFVPSVGYAGSAGSISFRAWDQTSGASGDSAVDASSSGSSTPYSTAIETATLTVVAGVDVAHLVPGAQSTNEDSDLVFSSADGNAITVYDGSSSDLVLQTTLSVSNGTLSLAATTGISFVAGADGTASMTIRGTESALNTALDGLRFTPASDYTGPADLQLTTRLWDPDLLGLYTFDGSNPAVDHGAQPANPANPSGGVGTSFDAARGGYVMDFDGSDDSLRISGLFGEPASVTLTAWVNLDSGFFDDTAISLGSNVAIMLDNTGFGSGVAGWFWDGSIFQPTSSNVFINGTGWRHVAFTFDDANDLQTLYIDGVPVASSSATESIDYSRGSDTLLGRRGDFASNFLHGKLDDVGVYDRALEASEIAALFNEQTVATDNVAITVTPVNDAPQGADATVSILEDTPYAFTAADFGFSDPVDGHGFAGVVITTLPGAGTLRDGATILNAGDSVSAASIANSNLVFTPAPDASGSPHATFTFQVRDDGGTLNGGVDLDSTPNTMTIDVTPVNDPPVAADDSATVAEGGSVTIDLAANDSDADDGLDLASIQIASGPANGNVVVNPNGTVDYTHNGSETNADSFTYTIRDTAGQVSGTATVSLTVTPVNDAPQASPDWSLVAEGGTVNIDLAANDSDVDDGLDLASIQIASGPSNGSVIVNANGTVDYSHDGSETFSDTFTYTIRDASGEVSNTQTVLIGVWPVNDVPIAGDDSATVAEGGSVVIDLAANDDDPDDGLDPASIQILTGPANGSIAVNADGTVDYTHDGSETNADSFTYTIRGSTGQLSNAATVSLTVTPVNDAPTAADDTATVAEGGSVNIDLAANDGDPDDGLDPASIQIVAGPANGTLVVNPDGSVDYSHDGSETNADGFTYTIRDAAGQVSGSATVSLTITPVNDAPAGADNTVITLEDTPYVFSVADFGFSDPAEGDALRGVVISTAPTAGTLRDGAAVLRGGETVSAASIAAGNLVFTPAPEASGTGHASFAFQVADDGGTANGGTDLDATPNTITVDVTPRNDAPVLVQSAPTLGSISEDDVHNRGETVATILSTSVSDADAGAREGIAITRLSSGNGSWQYSSDGGASWTPIGPVGNTSALLLRDSDRVRFVPDGENADSASFDFKAWDRTTGVFASLANAAASGGGYAFSSASDTASISVTPVNDAPGLQGAVVAPAVGDPANSPGEAVGALFVSRFSDVDRGARMTGVAVVGNGSSSGADGSWQYSSDGGASWFLIGAVGDDSSALALSTNTRLRFVPASGFDGTAPALQLRALDDSYAGGFSSTAGGSEARAHVDTGASGGSSAISGTAASLSANVVNAPDLDLDDPTPPPDEPPPPADEPGGEPTDPAEEAPSDPSVEELPPGFLPDGQDALQPFHLRGTSSQPFSDLPAEASRLELRLEAPNPRDLRSHDSRAEKAEERASTEAHGGGLNFVHSASELARELDRLRHEVEVDSMVEQQLFGSSIALTAGLSIGYIVWLTRGGLLIASLVSSMPVWRLIDPVPILAGLGMDDEESGEGAESLDSMLAAEPPDSGAGEPPEGAEGQEPPASGEAESRRGG